jgi:Xaa-Pro aminopeptidase
MSDMDEVPEGLSRAQRLAIEVAERVAAEARAGDTEAEVAARADALILELGGVGTWTPTVVGFGIGTLSCFPTDVPSDRALWNLDLGTVDVHPITHDGWWGDCTRTFQRGTNEPQRRALETVEAIHADLLAAARPGMRADKLFGLFADALAPTGYLLLDRLQNIGHSLGRETSYDDGYLDAFNDTVLTGAWALEPFIGNHLYGVKREDVLWFGPDAVTVVR